MMLLMLMYFVFAVRCNSPLGLESGAVADRDITASSAYDWGSVGPQHARYLLIFTTTVSSAMYI